MNPLENSDLILLITEFLDLKTCSRLLRINHQILNWLGKSKIWKRFHFHNSIFSSAYTYQYICQNLEGNKLMPTSIQVQKYYGEEYYQLVCQRAGYSGDLNIWDFSQSNEEDVRKAKVVLDDFYFRCSELTEPTERGLVDELFNNQKKFHLMLQTQNPTILKKIFIFPGDGPNFTSLYFNFKKQLGKCICMYYYTDAGGNVISKRIGDDAMMVVSNFTPRQIDKLIKPVSGFYKELAELYDPPVDYREIFHTLVCLSNLSYLFK